MKKIRKHGPTVVGILFIVALLISVASLLGEREKLDRNLAELNTVNESLVESNISLQDELWSTKDFLEQMISDIEVYEKASKDNEKELVDLNKKIGESDAEREKLLKEVQKLKSSNTSLEKQIEQLHSENAELKDKVSYTAPKVNKIASSSVKQESNKTPVTPASNSNTEESVEQTTVPSRGGYKEPVDKVLYMTSTAYTAYCNGCSGVTRTGIDLIANPGLKVIAVDPSVIPLGTKVHVEGYGYAIAGDTGGAINGNIIDVFIADRNEALAWGRKQVTVTILK